MELKSEEKTKMFEAQIFHYKNIVTPEFLL
jgi:hypothetical protein